MDSFSLSTRNLQHMAPGAHSQAFRVGLWDKPGMKDRGHETGKEKRTISRMHYQVAHHWVLSHVGPSKLPHEMQPKTIHVKEREKCLTISSVSPWLKVALQGINFPHLTSRLLLLECQMPFWSIPGQGIREALFPEVILGWPETKDCQWHWSWSRPTRLPRYDWVGNETRGFEVLHKQCSIYLIQGLPVRNYWTIPYSSDKQKISLFFTAVIFKLSPII